MSTEEKLDLRQTAYILANNIHGDTSKAEEIYQFLARAFDEKTECEESLPSKAKEIDWDRPQLVKCKDTGMVVKIILENHTNPIFRGVIVSTGESVWQVGEVSNTFVKSDFIYHGEIRPKKCANDTGVDCTPDTCICAQQSEKTTFSEEEMEECFNQSRLTHPMVGFKHDSFEDYLHWKKTGHFMTTKKSEISEEKTTDLNFLEAVKLCKAGKNIQRAAWSSDDFLYHSNNALYDEKGAVFKTPYMADFLATDWQIVKP